MTRFLHIVAALVWLIAGTVSAGDFDGSKLLTCAPVEAIDCTPGEECTKGRPDDIGAPNFLRIDFAQQVIVGPKRTTPIRFMDTSDDQILLQGTELGYGWTLALDQDRGMMTATLVNREGVFVLLGRAPRCEDQRRVLSDDAPGQLPGMTTVCTTGMARPKPLTTSVRGC
jgi:hypothetical protein